MRINCKHCKKLGYSPHFGNFCGDYRSLDYFYDACQYFELNEKYLNVIRIKKLKRILNEDKKRIC